MVITFNKRIRINNPRLVFLYMLFCALLAACLCFKFFYDREYLEYYSVQDYVHLSTWEDIDLQRPPADVLAISRDICLDYQCIAMCGGAGAAEIWDEDLLREYIHSFNGTNRSRKCVDPSHLAFSISNNEVFYLTRIHQTNVSDRGSENFVLPYEHLLNFSFHFSLAIPDRELYTFPETIWKSSIGWQGTKNARNSDQIVTVLLDYQGELKSGLDFTAGAVELSLLDLLELGGLDKDWLNQPVLGTHWAAGESTRIDGRSDTTLIGRETGIKLFLTVNCYDSDSHRLFSNGVYNRMKVEFESWSGTRCEVSVGHSTEFRARRDFEGVYTDIMEHHYGIHVVTRTGGYMSRTNYEYIYESLVTAYVLSKLPKILTLFVSCYLLGHLSTIYRRSVYEEFDIAAQVAGTSTRFMANTVSFEELCEPGEEAITYSTMRRRIGEAIQKRTDILDDAEVNALVSFCHKAVLDKDHFVQHERRLPEMLRGLVPLRGKGINESMNDAVRGTADIVGLGNREEARWANAPYNPRAFVDFGNFSAACSSNDKVSVVDVLKLFDRDRDTSMLERLFMPRSVRDVVIDAKGPRESGTGSPSQPEGLSSTRLPSSSPIEISVDDGFDASSRKASDSQRTSHISLSRHSSRLNGQATVGHKAYAKVLALEKQAEDLANNAADSARALAHSQKAMEMHVQTMLSKALSGELVLVEKASSHGDEAHETPEPHGTRKVASVFITRQEAYEVQQQNLQALADLQRDLTEYVDQSIQQCMENLGQRIMAEVMTSVSRALEESKAVSRADPRVPTVDDGKAPDGRDPLEPRPAHRDPGLPSVTLPVALAAPGSASGAKLFSFKKELVLTRHSESSKFASKRGRSTESSKPGGSSDSGSAAPSMLGEESLEREPQALEGPQLGQALGPPTPEAPPPGGTWVPWFKSTLGLAPLPALPGPSTQGESRASEDADRAVAYATGSGGAPQEAEHEHSGAIAGAPRFFDAGSVQGKRG